MAFEEVKPKAETKYYIHNEPDEVKEGFNFEVIKKGFVFEGYYHRTYFKDLANGKAANHVFLDKNNVHHIVSGSKDINKDIAAYIKPGLNTRLEYMGKNKFKYKTDSGKEGTASAHKWNLQQDKSDIVEFVGDNFAAMIKGTPGSENVATLANMDANANASISAADTPL